MGDFSFRRGAAEIEKASERKGGGNFNAFAPSIYWKGDKEIKYVLLLNDIESIPRLDLIDMVPVREFDRGDGTTGTAYEMVIDRRDPGLGSLRQRSEPLVDEFGARSRDSNLMVAVELEPITEKVRNREVPRGFRVATKEVTRRLRDDQGELTDDTEEITVPIYGFINGAANNFGAALASIDATEMEVHTGAIKVMRVGKDKNTQYQMKGFPEIPVDLGPLIDGLDYINYLTSEEREELAAYVSSVDNDEDVAQELGRVLLEKRLQEIADGEHYEEVLAAVRERNEWLNPFDKEGAKKFAARKSGEPVEEVERPKRTSQRSTRKPAAEADSDSTPQENPDRMNALAELRNRVAAK
jgi:hypothetical protein